MSAQELKDFLLWSAALNYGVLLVWFGAFAGAHEWLYRLHTRWFRLAPEQFDALHYGGMGIYKLGVLLFNIVPLIVLILIT